jgi:hypothetical protein
MAAMSDATPDSPQLPLPDEPPRRRRRRRATLSVRVFLLVVALAALPLGWYAGKVHELRGALRTVVRHEGWFYYNFEYHGPDGTSFPKAPRSWAPDWLRRTVGDASLHDVVWLRIDSPDFGDDDLALLKPLDRIESWSIYRSALTDRGMVHFRGRRALKALFLEGVPITDAGLTAMGLESLPALEILCVRGTRISPGAIQALKAKYPKLMVIYEDHASSVGSLKDYPRGRKME